MLWLATCVKLVCEVALMALLGRFVLGLLLGLTTGSAPESNPFHRLLGWVVLPLERRAGRWTAPLLMAFWLGATAAKLHLCLALGVQACR
jgi:hypothetical protein